MSAWKLTVRNGPSVARRQFNDLDAAIDAARRQVEEIRAEEPLETVSMLRDFDPGAQVRARLEISGEGLLRPPTAGIDVRGDGRLVAYSGSVRREELITREEQTPFELVRRALTAAGR